MSPEKFHSVALSPVIDRSYFQAVNFKVVKASIPWMSLLHLQCWEHVVPLASKVIATINGMQKWNNC